MRKLFATLSIALILCFLPTDAFSTVSSTDNKIIYAGDGSTTIFPYNFKIFANTDLVVTLVVTVTGTETTQTIITHYTVSDVGVASGGDVTMGTAPTTLQKLVIRRVMPMIQGIDLVDNTSFSLEVLEEGYDKLIMITQQLDEAQGRVVKAGLTSTVDLILPVPSALQAIGWNETEDGLVNISTIALTVTDTDTIDLTILAQNLQADIVSGSILAVDVPITDVSGLYTGTDVETALQEIVVAGAVTSTGSTIARSLATRFADSYNARDFVSFAAAVTSIGSTKKTLIITNEQNVTADITIPATLALYFAQGGSLSIDSGRTVTINGSLKAGLYQIFNGAGVVNLGSGSVETVNCGWFGDYTVDIGNSVNLAIAALGVNGGTIVLPRGKYPCLTQISLLPTGSQTVWTPITIVGWGGRNTYPDGSVTGGTIIDGSSLSTAVITTGAAANRYDITLRNFTVQAGSSYGIYIWSTWGRLDNIVVEDSTGDYGFYIKQLNGGSATNLYALDCDKGFYITICNTAYFNNITARDGNSDGYAITINGALGTAFKNLYIESNNGQALGIGGAVYSTEIGPAYFENNNKGGAATTEVYIGDSSGVAAGSTIASKFHSWYFTDPFSKFTNRILIARCEQSTFQDIMISGAGGAKLADYDILGDTIVPTVGWNTFMNIYSQWGNIKMPTTSRGNIWINVRVEKGSKEYDEDADIELNTITGFSYVRISGIRIFARDSVPSSATWKRGDIVFDQSPSTGSAPGWVNTHSGTFSAATDSTGDTDGSTAVITGMTDTSDFAMGDYVDVSVGFPTTGPYKIIGITSTTITLDTNSNSSQANITVDTSDPTFKAMADLAA